MKMTRLWNMIRMAATANVVIQRTSIKRMTSVFWKEYFPSSYDKERSKEIFSCQSKPPQRRTKRMTITLVCVTKTLLAATVFPFVYTSH